MRPLAAQQTPFRSSLHDRSKARLGWFEERRPYRRADKEFDLFVTADQNIRYPQNLVGRQMAILELSTNDLRRIQRAAAALCAAVDAISAGEFRHLEIP